MTIAELSEIKRAKRDPIWGKLAVTIGKMLVSLFFRPWLFMVGVGAAHGWISQIPPIGFWTAFFVVLGVRTVLNFTPREGG